MAGLPGPFRARDDAHLPSHEELVARICELTTSNFRLREKADRDGLILESATDFAIITLSMSGQITHWNPGAQRILGHTREQAIGQSGAIVFTPEDRKAGVFIEEIWKAFEHGSARNERWHLRRDGSRFWASGTMMPLLDTGGMICGFLNIMRDATAVAEAGQRQEFLLAEAQHRSKNTFATIYAVAARQAKGGTQVGGAFMSKLQALARSHELVELGDVTLAEVVDRSLAPYEDVPGQACTAGPPVSLHGHIAAALNSVLHELATNAAKYGAFSVPGGQVDVTWTTQADPAGGSPGVVVTWCETGGPRVVPPSRRGFGTRVIEERFARQPGSEVQLDFAEGGVTCRIRIPSAP